MQAPFVHPTEPVSRRACVIGGGVTLLILLVAEPCLAQGGSFGPPLATGIGAIPKKLIHGNGPFEFTPPDGLKLPGTLGDPTLFDVPPTFELPPSGTTPVLVDGSGLSFGGGGSFGFGGGLIDGGVPLIPGPGMPAAGLLALLHLVSRRRRG